MSRRRLALAALALAPALPAPVVALAAQDAPVARPAPRDTLRRDTLRRDTVATLLLVGTHPWLGQDGRIADAQQALRTVLGAGDAPRAAGWTQGGRATAQARAVLAAIVASTESDEGERADARTLAAKAEASAARPFAAVDDALFGVAMHVVALRHASVRAQGRLDPTRVHAEWSLAPEPVDLAALVATLQRDDVQPAAAFAQLEPVTPHYRRLVLARDAVRAALADSAALHALRLPPRPPAPRRGRPAPPPPVPGLAALARALVALGDLPANATVDTLRYVAPLADAAYAAKRRADPKATRTLDAATGAAVLALLAERERLATLAIERWRWLPRAYANQPLVVNIPEYRLERWAEWSGDTLAGGLAMNVVVGKADSNATPIFASSMTQVVFSPQWRVPVSIMKKEIGPAAKRNPGYLARHNYVLVTAKGDPLPTTPQNIERIGTGVYVRQRSGGSNSLGRVKFNMYNPYDIYLHDTPAKRFFARAKRDLSHGCVRLADPTALARFVLADNPAWTDTRIAEAMGAGKERFVPLRKSIPVLLVYHTLVAEPDGSMRRFADVYGHDARTLAALAGDRSAVPAPVTAEGAP